MLGYEGQGPSGVRRTGADRTAVATEALPIAAISCLWLDTRTVSGGWAKQVWLRLRTTVKQSVRAGARRCRCGFRGLRQVWRSRASPRRSGGVRAGVGQGSLPRGRPGLATVSPKACCPICRCRCQTPQSCWRLKGPGPGAGAAAVLAKTTVAHRGEIGPPSGPPAALGLQHHEEAVGQVSRRQ